MLVTTSCLQKKSSKDDLNKSPLIPTLTGKAYLQPLDKLISLSFASSKTMVFFDFIDSTYCNVQIYNPVESGVQSRKYTISADRVLTLTNPINDKKVAFKMYVNPDTTIYLRNAEGVNLYQLIPCSNKVNMLLISNNQLKKQEFLYPTLNEKEREFGAENQFTEAEGGKIISKPHPLRTAINKINIYKLF